MPLTLLLDLDDTLLETNLNAFLPAYFQALSNYLADLIEPAVMLPALMSGTRKMIGNNDPGRTLQQAFDAEFFPSVELPHEELQPRIDLFYQEEFPSLKGLTKPRPEAIDLIEWALDQGYTLGIATNPLFPRAAILHRLEWAGLPPSRYPFKIISSYESFHFAKPNPAFFVEILARMGWLEGAVLLVGDDTKNDIRSANALGLPSFQVGSKHALASGNRESSGYGTIAELRAWIEAQEWKGLEPSYRDPVALQAILRATPAAIAGMLYDLPESSFTHKPSPEAWNPIEVVSHLRDTDREINLTRVQTILSQDDPFLIAPDTTVWVVERGYSQQVFSIALKGFIAARMDILDLLLPLTHEQWQRNARHAVFGPSSLYDLVRFMAEHDRLHSRQIKEIAMEYLG